MKRLWMILVLLLSPALSKASSDAGAFLLRYGLVAVPPLQASLEGNSVAALGTVALLGTGTYALRGQLDGLGLGLVALGNIADVAYPLWSAQQGRESGDEPRVIRSNITAVVGGIGSLFFDMTLLFAHASYLELRPWRNDGPSLAIARHF